MSKTLGIFIICWVALISTACTSRENLPQSPRLLFESAPTSPIEHSFSIDFDISNQQKSSFTWVLGQNALAGIPDSNDGWYVNTQSLNGPFELVECRITHTQSATGSTGVILQWIFSYHQGETKHRLTYENFITREGVDGSQLVISHHVESRSIFFENMLTIYLSPKLDLNSRTPQTYSHTFKAIYAEIASQ